MTFPVLSIVYVDFVDLKVCSVGSIKLLYLEYFGSKSVIDGGKGVKLLSWVLLFVDIRMEMSEDEYQILIIARRRICVFMTI